MDQIPVKQLFPAVAARFALNICASIGVDGPSLEGAAEQYMAKKWNIVGNGSELAKQLTQCLGCRLYYDYGYSNPGRIKSEKLIFDIARELWVMQLLSELDKPCNSLELCAVYDSKFREEQEKNPNVSARLFYLLLNYYLYSDTQIAHAWNLLRQSQEEIQKGLQSVLHFLEGRNISYFRDLYHPVDRQAANGILGKKTPPLQTAPQSQSVPEESIEKKDFQMRESEDAKQQALLQKIEAEITHCHETIAKQAAEIRDYQKQISYLEQVNHDNAINLKFAQKDSVRNILECLTSVRFGSPLNELFLLRQNSDTPSYVRAIVINLFAALESMDISLFRTNQIGQTVLLTSDTQKAYVPAEGEQITLEDEVTIRYPGYRYGREMLIRPMIEKVRK